MNNIHYGRKRSGIKRELNKVIDEWVKTINAPKIRTLIKRDVIITGGSIASMLLGDPVNDYDVYFKTKSTARAVAEYYVKWFNDNNNIKTESGVRKYKPIVKDELIVNCLGEKEDRLIIFMKSAGVAAEGQDVYSYFESKSHEELKEFVESTLQETKDSKEKYRPVFLSDNAITLSDKMQIIIRFFGKPEEIHNNYDFAHAMSYYDYENKNLVLPAESLELLLSRTLIYRGSLYPIASVFRMKKFIERGWRISAGQQLKIMFQISELDLSDLNVLREQLIGVDMAYMHELIKSIKNVDAKDINSTYIAEIIDRIFD